MSITYPLSLPLTNLSRVQFSFDSVVGVSESPFTSEQQVYAHQGGKWRAQVDLVPMRRADAEQWVAFFLALNGREGTFLMGDPVNTTPRGSWSGTPLVRGGGQSGRVLVLDGFDPFATVKAGDWLQLGTGSTSHLYKATQDQIADSGGEIHLPIWPRLRAAPSDNDAVVYTSAKGLWRLASAGVSWSLEPAALYAGMSFEAVEAL